MKKTTPLLLALTLGIQMTVAGGLPAAYALTPQAREFYDQAVQAERRGDYDAAEQALRRAVALDPQDELNLVKLASVLNQQGKPNEALSYYQKALAVNPQDVMILYSMGSLYEQLGQYAKAQEAYALTLQNNPRYRFALLNLARTEAQLRQYDPAIAHYNQFLQAYPDHFAARRYLARLYLVTGREQDAVREFDTLKQRFPGQFDDHLDLARALNGANQPEQALQELQTAYKKEGSKSDIIEEMGRAHAALGQSDQAIRNYQKAYSLNTQKDDLLLRIAALYRGEDQPGMAVESYRTYLKAHPDNAEVRRMLAETCLEDKRYEAAAAELDTLLQNTTDAKERFELQKDMAYAIQMQGDLPQAARLYEQLLRNDATRVLAEKDLQLKSNLAIAYHRMKRPEDAAALYKQIYYAAPELQDAFKIDRASVGNDLAVALTSLGDAASKAGNFNAAVTAYGEAALTAAKDNPWPYMGLGNAYNAMRIYDKAYEAYGEALVRDPENAMAKLYRTKLAIEQPDVIKLAKKEDGGLTAANIQTLEALSRQHPDNIEMRVTLADAYARQGNASGALALYQQALALQPGNLDLLLAIGSQWQALGNFEQAKSAYERALTLDKSLSMLYYNLGIVYNELGQLPQSAEAYRQAMALEPNLADARYGLAVTLEKQQKYSDALETYREYVGMPGAQYASEAQTRVNLLQQAFQPTRPETHAQAAPQTVAPKTHPLIAPAAVPGTQAQPPSQVSVQEKPVDNASMPELRTVPAALEASAESSQGSASPASGLQPLRPPKQAPPKALPTRIDP